MKKTYLFFPILLIFILMAGCKKDETSEQYNVPMEDRYSTVEEFANALMRLDSLSQANNILAFEDTLPNGLPDLEGQAKPLVEFIGYILSLVEANNIKAAVDEVYGFHGYPYSLISYLMKAQMAENISINVMVSALSIIPLPPIPAENYVPPRQPIINPTPPAPASCPCDPRVKIKVTYSYKPACGNYTSTLSGYAAGNTLNNMKTGVWFRLDAEVEGCDAGGTWTNTVTTTAYSNGYSNPPGKTVGLVSYSSGEFVVTFTYKCSCGCDRSDTKTFKITF
ncbi:MAG: hypothetical protein L3J31_08305 [Bacteroidales bacterium]|nr:hypothetical protein [Bacteroidales bacterium]MCF6342790.1 hypothetical protein [Bacteroidales bacterium]